MEEAKPLTLEQMAEIVKTTDLVALRDRLRLVDASWINLLIPFIMKDETVPQDFKDKLYDGDKIVKRFAYNILWGVNRNVPQIFIFIVKCNEFLANREAALNKMVTLANNSIEVTENAN